MINTNHNPPYSLCIIRSLLNFALWLVSENLTHEGLLLDFLNSTPFTLKKMVGKSFLLIEALLISFNISAPSFIVSFFPYNTDQVSWEANYYFSTSGFWYFSNLPSHLLENLLNGPKEISRRAADIGKVSRQYTLRPEATFRVAQTAWSRRPFLHLISFLTYERGTQSDVIKDILYSINGAGSTLFYLQHSAKPKWLSSAYIE